MHENPPFGLNIYEFYGKLPILQLTCLLLIFSSTNLRAQSTALKPNPSFGYTNKTDSIEFVFGQQEKIQVGGIEIQLEKRINDIDNVNVAGDFNSWNPNNAKFQMTKTGSKLYKLTVNKSVLGKKGEIRQFKFVVNHKYWIEPPQEAANKYKGMDGNANLTLRL